MGQAEAPPKPVRTLEDCLLLLEGLLSSLGFEIEAEGNFEERVSRVWAWLITEMPMDGLIIRPEGLRHVQRLYA